jgi:ElaB/YqjD/DUF883 family membrane-anchored ribosome-binding protein
MNKNGITEPGGAERNVEDKMDSIRDTVKSYVDQGAKQVDALKHKVVEAKDEAFDRGSDLLDRTCTLIRANPIKSVAIAFGVGYFGMRIFRR